MKLNLSADERLTTMRAVRKRLDFDRPAAHFGVGGERAVAEIIGVPYDTVSQVGMFPVAYRIGTDFTPAQREPVSTFLHWDTW
jgi:hypothetical protein